MRRASWLQLEVVLCGFSSSFQLPDRALKYIKPTKVTQALRVGEQLKQLEPRRGQGRLPGGGILLLEMVHHPILLLH